MLDRRRRGEKLEEYGKYGKDMSRVSKEIRNSNSFSGQDSNSV